MYPYRFLMGFKCGWNCTNIFPSIKDIKINVVWLV